MLESLLQKISSIMQPVRLNHVLYASKINICEMCNIIPHCCVFMFQFHDPAIHPCCRSREYLFMRHYKDCMSQIDPHTIISTYMYIHIHIYDAVYMPLKYGCKGYNNKNDGRRC